MYREGCLCNDSLESKAEGRFRPFVKSGAMPKTI